MRCPSCQKETHETAAECECGFSLAALDRVLGMPPTLHESVCDTVGELTGGEIRRIKATIDRLERRFPQLAFAVVVCAPPEKVTLALYAFWLFNRGGLASAVERGGTNRMIMLGIDPHAGKMASMIGYGLEPFLAEARVTAAMNAAFAALVTDQTGKGIEAFFDEMERRLSEVATKLDQNFGLGELEFQGLAHLEEIETANVAAY